MSPSPIPRWDIPNLNQAECLYLFGAGREKRLYAVPPHTDVAPLEFEDVKFKIESFTDASCNLSGEKMAFMDELYHSDGSSSHVVNDSDFLDKVLEKSRPGQWSNKYLIAKLEQLEKEFSTKKSKGNGQH